jgi:hypothetical protein
MRGGRRKTWCANEPGLTDGQNLSAQCRVAIAALEDKASGSRTTEVVRYSVLNWRGRRKRSGADDGKPWAVRLDQCATVCSRRRERHVIGTALKRNAVRSSRKADLGGRWGVPEGADYNLLSSGRHGRSARSDIQIQMKVGISRNWNSRRTPGEAHCAIGVLLAVDTKLT